MRSEILFGDIAKFSNGKTSPDRDDNAKYNVFGSNGIIGKSNLSNTEKETIIIGRVGSYCGSVYYSKDKCWVTDNAIKCEAKNDNIPSFIYYQASKLNLNNFRVGSGQPLLNQGILNSLKINYFAPNTQKKIAHILSTLDDKIELNRKMNQTLEAMAQALFKSWFVDFDPVHAKMGCTNDEELEVAARELGISKKVLELFPSEFEESELGMIPEGWKIDSIYSATAVIYGAAFASSRFNSAKFGKPLIRIRDLKNEAPGVYTPEIHPKGYLVQPGDIVVGMDGEFRAYLWGGEEAWLNQRVCVFTPNEDFSGAFVRLSIKPLLAFIEATVTATTVIHLGKGDIDRFRILLPNKKILSKFNMITEPIYSQIVVNKQENKTLQKTRDTLLPKLLSGELDVSELELDIS